jgi:hypothetical protein
MPALDTTTLEGTITGINGEKKSTVYPYVFSDLNAMLEQGLGPVNLTFAGYVSGTTDRDALMALCETKAAKKFKFPSIIGAGDDRYYNVYTDPIQIVVRSATFYKYTLKMTAVDPKVYYVATDLAVW